MFACIRGVVHVYEPTTRWKQRHRSKNGEMIILKNLLVKSLVLTSLVLTSMVVVAPQGSAADPKQNAKCAKAGTKGQAGDVAVVASGGEGDDV